MSSLLRAIGRTVLCFGPHHADPLPGVLIRCELPTKDDAPELARVSVRVLGDPPNVPFHDDTWTGTPLFESDSDGEITDGFDRFCEVHPADPTLIDDLLAEPDPQDSIETAELPATGDVTTSEQAGSSDSTGNDPTASSSAAPLATGSAEGGSDQSSSSNAPASEVTGKS